MRRVARAHACYRLLAEAATDEAAQRRSEAMEALTRIEIAFAALRDRLYVERMAEVNRESEMILDGVLLDDAPLCFSRGCSRTLLCRHAPGAHPPHQAHRGTARAARAARKRVVRAPAAPVRACGQGGGGYGVECLARECENMCSISDERGELTPKVQSAERCRVAATHADGRRLAQAATAGAREASARCPAARASLPALPDGAGAQSRLARTLAARQCCSWRLEQTQAESGRGSAGGAGTRDWSVCRFPGSKGAGGTGGVAGHGAHGRE